MIFSVDGKYIHLCGKNKHLYGKNKHMCGKLIQLYVIYIQLYGQGEVAYSFISYDAQINYIDYHFKYS